MNGIYQLTKPLFYLWKIWNRPSPIKLVEEKEKVEVSKGLNPDYGAYVWLAGKRFN